MPEVYRPLMRLPSIRATRCVVCSKTWPLNQHHIAWRSWGELYEGGRRVEKPTVTLCGSGNASGCHGLAHQRMLHFRNNGGACEFLRTEVPTRYERALEADGWRPVRDWSEL